MLAAVPSGLTRMPGCRAGRPRRRPRTSSPVGAMSLAPGMAARPASVASMLDAGDEAVGVRRCRRRTRELLRVNVVHERRRSRRRTRRRTGRRCRARSSCRPRARPSRMSLIVSESWLTHWIGSVWSVELVLDEDAADEDQRRWRRPAGRPRPGGSEPSYTVSRPRAPSRKSLPLVGDRYSRMPRVASGQDDRAEADDGDADGQQQAELADHRHLGEAQGGEGEDGVEGDDEQRRAEVARRLLDRVLGPVDDDLLLDAARASGSRSRCRRRASPAGRRW